MTRMLIGHRSAAAGTKNFLFRAGPWWRLYVHMRTSKPLRRLLLAAAVLLPELGCTVQVFDQKAALLRCGNGLLDRDEQCDDGNTVSGDGCSADCRSNERCGNAFLDVSVGELCDTAGDSATCDSDCTLARCGDGHVNAAAGEQCDDGNLVGGDGCENDCTLSP
jgi:cysteine-rich repeat protein